MKPTVYIETTIVSYLTARPTRDLVRAAQQEITRDWWDNYRKRYHLCTSVFALIEASAGDSDAAAKRVGALDQLDVLAADELVLRIAARLVERSALPDAAIRDAEHVAICAFHGVDVLLTWNCRHLANVFLRDRIEQACESLGYRAPKICTPEEMMGENHG